MMIITLLYTGLLAASLSNPLCVEEISDPQAKPEALLISDTGDYPSPPKEKITVKKPIVKKKPKSSPEPDPAIKAKMKYAKQSISPESALQEAPKSDPEEPPNELVGLFGIPTTEGRDFEGTMYCIAKSHTGNPQPISQQEFFKTLAGFVEEGWNPSFLNSYYHSPNKLYASCMAIPPVPSSLAALSFGEATDDSSQYWAVHYQGKITHKDGISFRLWGVAEDVLTVAIDRHVVLAANYPDEKKGATQIAEGFTSKTPGSRSSQAKNDGVLKFEETTWVGSDWITLKPGEVYEFDALIAKGEGEAFSARLMFEIMNNEYKLNNGVPLFEFFATQPLPQQTRKNIVTHLQPEDAVRTDISTFFIYE